MKPVIPNWYFMGSPPGYLSTSTEKKIVCIKSEHVVVMVGLPGRSKTSTANKLVRYLKWIGIKSKVFSVESSQLESKDPYVNCQKKRELSAQCTTKSLEEISLWLHAEGEVAVLDCENSMIEQRNLVHDIVVNRMGFKLFFIEIICNDPKIGGSYIAVPSVKSPDRECVNKIQEVQNVYESMDARRESHLSFMKLFDSGKKVAIHKHSGHMQGRFIYFVINTRVTPQTVYLTRHGESEMNVQGRIGGNSNLSERGLCYARKLAQYMKEENVAPGWRVWTSWMKRCIQTAAHIELPQERWKALNEINAGIFEGLTYQEIKEKYPDEHKARCMDKFNYRYPNGENYKDVISRLEPVVMEMERQGKVLVITHQSIIRCLLGFFLETPTDTMPHMKVLLHTVYKLSIFASGVAVEEINLPVDAVTNECKSTPRVSGPMLPSFVATEEEGQGTETCDLST